MRYIIITLVSFLVFTSCRTSRYVENTTTAIDTVYIKSVVTQHHDSIIYVHDSIMQSDIIYITLDSVGKETKRIEYHNRDHYNTASSVIENKTEQNDSLSQKSITHQSTIQKTVTQNTLSLFQKVEIWIGRICITFLLLILFYYLLTHGKMKVI